MKSSTAFFISTFKPVTCCFERDTNSVVDKKTMLPQNYLSGFKELLRNVKKLFLFS